MIILQIVNFELITAELTRDERQLIKILIAGFKSHVGRNNAILSDEIVRRLNDKKATPKKVTGVRLRKMCNFIRSKGMLPLIATSHGYFISNDSNEIRKQIQSLNERADAIRNSAKGLETFL